MKRHRKRKEKYVGEQIVCAFEWMNFDDFDLIYTRMGINQKYK